MGKPTLSPSFFPWEIVELALTWMKQMVTKIGIDGNGNIDYLLWDWVNYNWTDLYQIKQIEERTIWFNIKYGTDCNK